VKKLLITSLMVSTLYADNFCADGIGKTLELAKSSAIDTLVNNFAVTVNSVHSLNAERKNNDFSSSFNQNVSIKNVIDFIPEVEVTNVNAELGFFNDSYTITVCTNKNIIKNKLLYDVNDEFQYIQSTFNDVNLQNKNQRKLLENKIDNLITKINVYKSMFNEDFSTSKLIDFKNKLSEKRLIKIIANNDSYFENKIGSNLIKTKNKSHYTLTYNSVTNFKSINNTSLVKVNHYVSLMNAKNDIIYSFEYTTIGEAKTKQFAVNNAFNKFKDAFNKSEMLLLINHLD